MLKYILRRTFYSVWVIAGVLLLTFVLFNVASGDPAAAILGKHALPGEIEALQDELGSNLPLFYGHFCKTSAFDDYSGKAVKSLHFIRKFPKNSIAAKIRFNDGSQNISTIPDGQERVILSAPQDKLITEVEFFHRQPNPWRSQFTKSLTEVISLHREFPYFSFFNFGNTLVTREPIKELIWRGMWPSLILMLPVFAGEIILGIIIAMFATAFAGKWQDKAILLFSVALMSLSYLVAIIFGQWLFGYQLELFPIWGNFSPWHYGLPILIGTICGMGSNIRFFRTVFADELRKEYLRTAAAKGVHPAKIYFKHLLRNSLIQIITRVSSGLPYLFTGSLLLESFFGIPGLGFAGIEALRNSDIQLLKALVILSALLFVVINLLADLAYAWADPRIRLNGSGK